MTARVQNVAFLERRIRQLIKDERKSVEMRSTMANVVIGQMLPRGVVRGWTLMNLRYGRVATRFTRDFDAAQNAEVELFREELEASLRKGWADFSGRLVDAPRAKSVKKIKLREDYLMTPFYAKLMYRNHPWCTVKLEISPNEIGDADEGEMIPVPEEVAAVFDELGFPKPAAIPAMTIEYQIAQKIHGMTKRNNLRARDLVDLQLIVKNEKRIRYKKVGQICRRLFAYRQQQTWPSNVSYEAKGWETLYRESAQGVDVLQSVEDAVPWGNALIAKIDKALRWGK